MPVETLSELFVTAAHTFPRPDLFTYRDHTGKFVDISSEEALRRVRALRFGLKSLGVKSGDKVGILSENRVEWALSDLAGLCAGAVTVPIYATLLPGTIEYILNDCRPAVLFVSTEEQAAKIQQIRERLPFLKDVITFDEVSLPGVMDFGQLLRIGQNLVNENPPTPSEDYVTVDKHSPCSIIYTSGTTGNPKGVVLSHWNFVSNVQAIQGIFPILPSDKTLSFLPLSHVLERMAGYYTILNAGGGITYAERMDTVPVDIIEAKPTILISVPRLYEKIYAKAMATAVGAGGMKKNIFFWAREIAMRCAKLKEQGQRPSGWLAVQQTVADALVFKKLRAKLGGNVRFMVSGGAPLGLKINQFFHGCGLDIFEGYGLTETSPVLSCNYTGHLRYGSIGKVLPGTEIKIAQDGEIVARGPQVMLGYFNKEEATREVLDQEGWFATGDIGHFDDDGFLFITDRKKDIIVTAGGKNIAPQPIENRFTADKLVTQMVIIGDRRPFLSSLIVPNFEFLEGWVASHGGGPTDIAKMLVHAPVLELFQQLLDKVNADLPGFNQIKKFTLLDREFTLEDGELTPTMKVKRFAINRKYESIINKMYPAAIPGRKPEVTSPDPASSKADAGPGQQSAWLRPFFCTAIGLVGNSLLSAGKILVGMFAGSAALVADGYHSLADVLSDIGILLALKASNQPPDDNHPYGHHSFETLGAIVVAVFMLLTAIFIGRGAVLSFINRDFQHPELPALAASLVSVVVKEVMARYTIHVGRLHHSPALLANGAMHRSDAISSLAASVGIGGAIAGWPFLDSVGAIVIALFILKMGWDLLRENVMALMDTMPDPGLVGEIRNEVEKVPCIQEVRALHVRQRGSWFLADLRIAVHPDHTIESAHNIAHQAEDTVRTGVPKIARVFVHVEPGERKDQPECPTCDSSDRPE